MPRPRKYASAAEKQAAFRARQPVRSIRFDAGVFQTLTELGEQFGESLAEVVNQMCKFALTNRDWKAQGFAFKRLPHANPIDFEGDE